MFCLKIIELQEKTSSVRMRNYEKIVNRLSESERESSSKIAMFHVKINLLVSIFCSKSKKPRELYITARSPKVWKPCVCMLTYGGHFVFWSCEYNPVFTLPSCQKKSETMCDSHFFIVLCITNITFSFPQVFQTGYSWLIEKLLNIVLFFHVHNIIVSFYITNLTVVESPILLLEKLVLVPKSIDLLIYIIFYNQTAKYYFFKNSFACSDFRENKFHFPRGYTACMS